MQELNKIFTAFDELTELRGAQKIKTTGDGYMAVAGVPDPHPDHLQAVCDLALAMQETIRRLATGTRADLRLRIGIHTGPVVAGIIGASRSLTTYGGRP